ncbi:telomere length regulator protein [Histoplasma capsulatum H143]|uniref:Telomere length regulator protein n=1 Tax=Ajellomyces capsulatus (strain H143) TaxID=544712 RepID=C6H2Y9_AJECH|nr:telomere length regulator protein [Histoplasma capsulatum H143]
MVEVLSFSALPARPPTPPRSSSLKSAVLKSDIQQLPSHQAPLSTPSDGFSSPPNLSPFPQSSGLSKRHIPDEGALADQVETFSQYIRRDICEVSGIYQPLDIKLVRQALKLLAMFIYEPNFSSRLPDDLEDFVIDHAIASLQNPNVPKTVAIEYMRVLSMQKCSPKVMTSNRVTLLLSVLKDITNRVEGKAVLAHRLAIYRELLLLPQSTMASHADLWMDHLITALLHNLKDIRTRAIKVGKLAAMAMGPNTTVSVALREVLDVTLENGSLFVAELCDRLSAMISSPDSGSQVPQIWSVIILLLRTKRWSIDNWPHLKDWLLVIQRCFNCSDIMTKSQALMAWDLFVYALSPNESTSTDITKILFRPILSQIERKKSDKQGILVNQAFTSYHRLLYYAFRPSASHSRLAFFWTIYIGNPFSGNLNSDPTNNERLCRILSYLLWNQQPKIWEEDKIGIIKGTTLEPEDLPRLDCRWIRSRLPIILPVFKSLFKSSAWNDDDIAKSGIGLSWTNLSKALSDAGSNEITPSSESMQAIASILGTLQRVWRTAPLSLNANGDTRNDTFYKRFQFLLTTVVSSTGPTIFTDKLFAQISQDRFQTATTPAHNRQSVDNNVKSPLLHLLHLITFSPLPSSTISPAYFQLLHVIIEMGVQGKTSRYAKLEVLRQFADLLLEQSGNVSDVNLECLSNCHHVWQSIAKLAKGYLLAFPMRTEIMKRDGSAPNDYENVITILVAGSRLESSFSEWSLLLDSFSSVVRAEKGEASLTGILETLSETISSQPLAAVAGNCAALLDLLEFTSVQEQPPSPTHPSINKSPFAYRQIQHHSGNKLIELTGKVLKEIYVELAGTDHSRIVRFLASTTKLIDRCPSSFGPILLSELQDSLGLWITDRDGVLTSRPDVGNNISASARELILSTTKLLQKSAESKDTLLQKLSTLVTSGLESRHKFTANQFIKLWNNSFGSRTTLEYPENVEKALRRLKPFVHLSLPNFPQEENSTIDLSSPDFLSSQEDMVESETPIKLLDSTSKIYKAFSPSPAQSTTPSSTNKACRRKRSTPSTSKLSTPKPRLRHDDSQIRFVPVDSSPAPNAGNEENFPDRSPTSTPETSVVQLDQMVKSPLISVLDIVSRQSEDPSSSPPQISHHENRSIEASETKRICDVKNQEIVMSDDLSSPPRSSPTPISGDPSHRRSMFSSRKTAEWKATRTNKVINPEPKDITSQGDYPSIFPTQDADLVPSEESENNGHSNSSNPNCPFSNIEVDRIDIIPDSFSNDLERQIASQLEQDLELSMDMEVSSKGTPEPNASIVTRSMKRKRDDKSSHERDRIKRVSPNRRSKVVVDESVASEKIPSHQENITCGNEVVPSKRPSRSSRKKTNSILDSAKIINPSQEIGKPAHCPNHRKSKKRRSLRLSGQPALPAPSVEQRDEQMAHQMSPDSEMAKNTAADVEMSNQTDHPYSKEGDLAGSMEQETRSGKPETSGAGILASLRSVLGSIRTVTFGRRMLREIEDVMFDIKVEAHDAERRHNENA